MSKHPQHGQPQRHAVVLIVTLLAMVLLAGLVMYVFNAAHHVNQRRHLQDIADASAHAGASWMARGLNTVAMNNVAITRLIAAVNVIDAIPQAIDFTLMDQRTLSNSLRSQLQHGVAGFWVGDALAAMRTEIDVEVDLLTPLDDLMSEDDVAALTVYASPTGRGSFWEAMIAADTISTTLMETMDTLVQRSARAGVESNAGAETMSVMLPLFPQIPWRRGQFADFRRPVTLGLLPAETDDKIIRRGPWDTVFGWRDLVGGTTDSHFVPGTIQNAGGGSPSVSIGRGAGRGNGHTVVTHREPDAYRVYGPFNWMLRRMSALRHDHLWHSRFDHWVARIARRKMHDLWPTEGSDGLGDIIIDPVYVTDFDHALAIAADTPGWIVETVFVAVEVKSRSPLISAQHDDAWAYVDAGSEHRSPRVVRVRGWENPQTWGVPQVADHVWRDTWTYQVYADPEIGISASTEPDGVTPISQEAYRTDDYVFIGVNIGTAATIRNPNNFTGETELPAPVTLEALASDPITARREGFRTLGLVQRADRAPMWGTRFTGRKPYPHLVASAQCAVFNNHSWDAWTQMWHVRVEPVSDYDGWILNLEEAAADLTSSDALPPEETMPPLADLAEYLRSTFDLADSMLSH